MIMITDLLAERTNFLLENKSVIHGKLTLFTEQISSLTNVLEALLGKASNMQLLLEDYAHRAAVTKGIEIATRQIELYHAEVERSYISGVFNDYDSTIPEESLLSNRLMNKFAEFKLANAATSDLLQSLLSDVKQYQSFLSIVFNSSERSLQNLQLDYQNIVDMRPVEEGVRLLLKVNNKTSTDANLTINGSVIKNLSELIPQLEDANTELQSYNPNTVVQFPDIEINNKALSSMIFIEWIRGIVSIYTQLNNALVNVVNQMYANLPVISSIANQLEVMQPVIEANIENISALEVMERLAHNLSQQMRASLTGVAVNPDEEVELTSQAAVNSMKNVSQDNYELQDLMRQLAERIETASGFIKQVVENNMVYTNNLVSSVPYIGLFQNVELAINQLVLSIDSVDELIKSEWEKAAAAETSSVPIVTPVNGNGSSIEINIPQNSGDISSNDADALIDDVNANPAVE